MGASLGLGEGAAEPRNAAFSESLKHDFWLANGLGGWVSTSELGINSRKYHALFSASLSGNPANVHILLSKYEDTAVVNGTPYDLSSNCYPGKIHPDGLSRIKSFELEGGTARWEYEVGEGHALARIRKEAWPSRYANSSFVRYSLLGNAEGVVSIIATPLVSCRPAHSIGLPAGGIRFKSHSGSCEFTSPAHWSIFSDGGSFTPHELTYYNMQYPLEQPRGEAFSENLFSPGHFRLHINSERSATLSCSLGAAAPPAADSDYASIGRRRARFVSEFSSYNHAEFGTLLESLVCAADQFVVRHNGAHAIAAGYPYFGIWGRDTFISLPGIAVCTGRHALALDIINSYFRYEKKGMLPNFIGSDGTPSYDAADVPLWAVWALWHLDNGGGLSAADKFRLYIHLRAFALSFLKGNALAKTEDDGLLSLTSPRATWMDASIDGKPVTPREGRRIEINALYIFALSYIAKIAHECHDDKTASMLDDAHMAARSSFPSFFNEYAGFFDDGIKPTDGSLRPNQLWALALPGMPVSPFQAKAALSQIREHLLTPCGLRTLAPNDKKFHSHYSGNQRERDAAYHQGAIWPWLLGAYADATLLHQPDRIGETQRILSHILSDTKHGAHGTIAEVYDPTDLTPSGCPSQAWSVAEVLRASVQISRAKSSSGILHGIFAERRA